MTSAEDEELFDHGPISLYALLPEVPAVDCESLTRMLAAYDAELDDAEVEEVSLDDASASAFVARFAGHTLVFRVFDMPLVEAFIEPSIQLAHYEAELKDAARAHRAAISVEYVGTCDPPRTAHVVVAAGTGALAPLGVSVIANVRARTSVPTGLLAKSRDDMTSYLTALPPLLIYSGFAKYVVEGSPGLWMRTHGNAALGLPDFARQATGQEQGEQSFMIFSDMMLYLLGSDAHMSPGDVAQIGEDQFTLIRAARPDEGFLDQSDGLVLVVEVLDHAELTRLHA